MLVDLVKKIPAGDPRFVTWFRYSGFFSHVWVDVPDAADPSRFREEFCSSFHEFQTAEEAEEKAAGNMIRSLENSCKFETKDLNWEMKRCFHINSYNSCIGRRGGNEEIRSLKMKIEELKNGWRSTLEAVENWSGYIDSWSGYIDSCGYASSQDAGPFVLYEGVTNFQRVCREKYV